MQTSTRINQVITIMSIGVSRAHYTDQVSNCVGPTLMILVSYCPK